MNTAFKKHLKMPVAAVCFAVVLEIQAWGLTGGSLQAGRAPAHLPGDATDAPDSDPAVVLWEVQQKASDGEGWMQL